MKDPEKQYHERVYIDHVDEEGIMYCSEGLYVEDFENPLNLMISESVDIYPSFKKALNAAKDIAKNYSQ